MENPIKTAIQWISRLISLIETWQLKLRFKRDAAKVRVQLGTGLQYGDQGDRTNRHYVELELNFLNEWADKISDIDLAMTLGRPQDGVRRKIQRT